MVSWKIMQFDIKFFRSVLAIPLHCYVAYASLYGKK